MWPLTYILVAWLSVELQQLLLLLQLPPLLLLLH
jgi:hypothetical protein